MPKISEARELDDQALESAIVDTKKKLFNLRFQQATRQLEGGLHQFKHERHRLAQLMTVLRERQLQVQESDVQAEAAAEPETETEAPQAATVSAAEEE
jgi:large subunit ribosomal protein L29